VTALIGALRVSLSADTANFEAGMRRAQGTANSGAAQINKSLGTIKAGIGGFAAAFTIGALSRAIGDALEYAGSLGEVSQQLGVTTKDLQTFRFMAGQVGVSQDQLETGLSKLTITMGKVAAGAKAPTDALRAIGISADELKGKDTGEAFRMIADGLQKVTDRSQRAAVEVALFGKSGAMLDNMLAGGSSQINELSAAAERLGIVLSDEEIKHADETADKLRAVKTVLEAQIAGVVAKNADSILALASSLGTLSGEIVKFLSTNPQLALGIIGALLGGRVGGLPGAVVGGAAGAILGGRMAQNMANSNTDRNFRRGEFVKAETAYQRGLQSKSSGPAMSVNGVQISGSSVNIKSLKAERDRQEALFRQAVIASHPKPAPKAGASIPQFLAPAASKSGGGGHAAASHAARADHTAEEQLRDQQQFNSELRRSQMDVLQARRDLAHSATDQAALDLQMLDLQKQDHDAELQYQVELNKLTGGQQGMTAEQAKQLQAEYDKTDALKRQAIAEDLAAKKVQDAAELQDNAYSLQIELLQHDANIARTAKERRAAELRILAVMKEQEKARLEAVIADKASSDLAKQEAQARLNKLDEIYAGRADEANKSTMGPLESFLDTLPKSAADANEALQSIAAEGLQSFNDGIVDAIMNSKSLGEVFHNVAQQILADLLKLALKQAEMALFNSAMSAFGGGGGGGSLAGMSDFSSIGSGLNFGTTFASGGFVSGPGGPKEDKVPAMLSAGEFVVNAASARKFLPFLHALNEGKIQHRKGGGILSGLFGGFASMGKLSMLGGLAFSSQGRGALPLGAIGKILGFSEGGLVPSGLPIPRASFPQHAMPVENNVMMAPVTIAMNNDFRGADPAAVGAINARLNQMEADLPGRVVSVVQDAKTRFILR
jgi:lambda family phage tail tape measure protein